MIVVRRLPTALIAALAMTGCTLAPLPALLDPRPGPAAPPVDAVAQRAIAACLARAEAQGLAVAGVGRAEEVVDGAGTAIGQNVFLEVGSGGSRHTVRCSYGYAGAEARIMTL